MSHQGNGLYQLYSNNRAEKCECCHGDSSVFKNIYSMQPGNICPKCSLSGKWANMRVHTHTLLFSPLEKVNHDRGLWKWQTHKQPESGASGSASLCRIYGRWKWTMKSHFKKNFSFVRHQLNSTRLLTHIHCQVLLCIFTTFESELIPMRSHFT